MKAHRRSAWTAGWALIVMAIVATFSYGYAHNTLILPEDAASTLSNLTSSGMLFRAEIISWVLIILLDLVVAWALYHFFKDERKTLSMTTAVIRVVYAVILGLATFNFISVLSLLKESPGKEPAILAPQVMEHLTSFEHTYSLGLIIFGVHLVLLGVLAIKSMHSHAFWGILLLISGASYLAVHGLRILFPSWEEAVNTLEMILMVPMVVGEIGFAIWLVVRGGKKT